MEKSLKRKAIIGNVVNPIIFGAPIFLAAGTLDYWQGWLFQLVFMLGSVGLTVYLYKHNQALLERRLHAGPRAETRPAQRIIMMVFTIACFLLLILSGLDRRFGWSHLSPPVVILGDCLVIGGFIACYLVFRENSFASATIEIAENHKVISTGPYGIVRHPMYSGGSLLLLGIPPALGSLWPLPLVVALLPMFIWRVFDEEKLLNTSLDGYPEYCKKVKYRLVPFVF
jgi:protein-S-isoprenylcysteine O-methyltransferase Ste14